MLVHPPNSMVQVLSSLCNCLIAQADGQTSPKLVNLLEIWKLGHWWICHSSSLDRYLSKRESISDELMFPNPLSLKLELPETHLIFLHLPHACHFELWPYAEQMASGLISLFKREEFIFIYLYITFLKLMGFLRMSSEFRHTRSKLCGWEQASSMFHVGSDVIQSVANECFHILWVNIFLVLWSFEKSFSALANQPSNHWSKWALGKTTFTIVLFSVLGFPEIPLPHMIPLSSFVVYECICLSNNQKSPEQDSGGRWQAIAQLYWVVAMPFLNCPLYSVNHQCSILAIRTTADPSALRSPKDKIWGEIDAILILSEMVA